MTVKIALFNRRSYITAAVILTLIIYGIEEFFFKYPQLNYLLLVYRSAKEVPMEATAIAIGSIISSFFLAAILFYGFFAGPYWFRIAYGVIFASTVIGEYGYQKGFHRFARADDVEIGMTTSIQTWLDAFRLYSDWKILIPVFLLIIFSLLILPKPDVKMSILSVGIIVSLIFSQNSVVKIYPWYGLNRGISLIQGINSVADYIYLQATAKERETITYQSKSLPDNNIVLIIDESLRGDHLSVNGYYRPTTPYLETLSLQTDLFHNWGIAIPGTTCSVTANGLLITGEMIAPGTLELIKSHPTIFQYAKAMRYKTIYMDAQMNYLWDGMGPKDIKFLDERITAADLNKGKYQNQRDALAASKIREITDNSTGNFIVFNKRGVHFIYEDDYPKAARNWTPVPETTAEFESRPDLTINSYDNAILYNVNGFFYELFPDSGKLAEYTKNTVYIYTSDHADSLFERGAAADHCGGTKEESQVPLIIIGKLPLKVDTEYRASHSNIFPTILDLMKIPLEARSYRYNISLLQAQASNSKDRLFFAGDGTIINHDKMP